MKALSVKQPWAHLICAGMPLTESVDLGDGTSTVKLSGRVAIKDIENRSWPIPKWFKLPQRIYVHAGQKRDEEALMWLFKKGFAPMVVLSLYSDKVPVGALVGEVDIVGCVTQSDSPWFAGPYGFVLANPVLYKNPLPCKGKLGFFDVPYLSREESPDHPICPGGLR
jgi:hypothetical protein